MTERPHVVVVGGGISGLAAAHALRRMAGDSVRVTVLERAATVGGKLATAELDGLTVDLGAESILARRPEGVRLVQQVGLGQDLVHQAASGSMLWTRGRLRRLPRGLVMGIPTDLRDLAAAEVVSLRGLARIPLDLVLPGAATRGDRAVGPYVAHRLGREVVDRLVEPLLGGVYAGHADQLSLDAVLPQVARAVRVERSLLRGAVDYAGIVPNATGDAAAPAGGALFAGIRGGVGRLPAAVAAASGARVRTRCTVRGIEATDSGWRVVLGSAQSPETLAADAVVLALPALPAARLLAEAAAPAATELHGIPYASVAVVTLAVRRRAVPPLPPGTGFLVPPVDGRVVKAATFASQKWAWSGRQRRGLHLIRASVGRFGEEDSLQVDDVDLKDAAVADLARALGWSPAVAATSWQVTRWGGALPQYLVGHLDRVARIRATLAEHAPGLAVCGAAYDGVGIPACVASGESAAAQVLRGLRARPQWAHGFTAAAVADGA